MLVINSGVWGRVWCPFYVRIVMLKKGRSVDLRPKIINHRGTRFISHLSGCLFWLSICPRSGVNCLYIWNARHFFAQSAHWAPFVFVYFSRVQASMGLYRGKRAIFFNEDLCVFFFIFNGNAVPFRADILFRFLFIVWLFHVLFIGASRMVSRLFHDGAKRLQVEKERP